MRTCGPGPDEHQHRAKKFQDRARNRLEPKHARRRPRKVAVPVDRIALNTLRESVRGSHDVASTAAADLCVLPSGISFLVNRSDSITGTELHVVSRSRSPVAIFWR